MTDHDIRICLIVSIQMFFLYVYFSITVASFKAYLKKEFVDCSFLIMTLFFVFTANAYSVKEVIEWDKEYLKVESERVALEIKLQKEKQQRDKLKKEATEAVEKVEKEFARRMELQEDLLKEYNDQLARNMQLRKHLKKRYNL